MSSARGRDRAVTAVVSARGEPYMWLTGMGLVVAIAMIVGLLAMVLYNGGRTFWPRPLVALVLADGTVLNGEIIRSERYAASDAAASDAKRERLLLRTGNYDLSGEDFRWVDRDDIRDQSTPRDLWLIERLEWGVAIARPEQLLVDGEPIPGTVTPDAVERLRQAAHARLRTIARLERDDLGDLNRRQERHRLDIRRAELDHGVDSPEHRAAVADAAEEQLRIDVLYREIQDQVAALRAEDTRYRLAARVATGELLPERPTQRDQPMLLSQIVRVVPANDLSSVGRLGVYLSRWWEFLSSAPREANTEGGVFPAIFGTFVMTVLMSLVVSPFGVVAALYLREYARPGLMVSAVRIAVNNLAGVPSIVYGVFGLGFFCYFTGGTIDQLFFSEHLPSPTFGTGGVLWASLTLALLTVPVVIVATEEALAAVPNSMREGSYGCGASKWQTIRRIVLPYAVPGILTGLILAMARGAGEVAPLMLTGVVKLAPELPIDGHFPFVHLERSFMHLGFHIFDVGFQSRNSEAGKPMVFTTTLLLITLVLCMNMTAVYLRARLKRRFKAAQF